MEPQGDLPATADAGAVTPLPSMVAGGDESAPNPSSPPRGTDLAADESLEDMASPEPREPSEEDDADQEQEPDNGQIDHSSGTVAVTADDLKRKIIKQVEYYFSDENLPTDKYLMGFIKKNKEGYVPTGVIASFRKMKKLTRDHAVIVAALKESTCLVVNPDGKKVKRLNPLPVVEQRDPKLYTVLVENLPDDHSVHNLRRIFGEVGRIKNVCVHDPTTAEESKKGSKVDKFYSSKLHALVEYDSAEAAEKAANTLNNEQDWRNGMRVKLLKRVTMYGNRRQAWTGPDTEKKTAGRPSDHVGDGERKLNENHEDITPDEESGERGSKDKSGDKVRNHHGNNNNNNNNHGRGGGGRKHKQQHRGGLNGGHGHGSNTIGLNSSHSEAPLKPPPGPRMPDGTRGFTLGRGKPL